MLAQYHSIMPFFENSDSKSLYDFSKKKGRSKKVYIDTYEEYFIAAKKKINS